MVIGVYGDFLEVLPCSQVDGSVGNRLPVEGAVEGSLEWASAHSGGEIELRANSRCK